MKIGRLDKDGLTLIGGVELAVRVHERMRGLLGRDGLEAGRAMHIARAGSIHTCFMKFSLDLIFLDATLGVVRLLWDVPPWRIVPGGRGARSVVEMAAGWFPRDVLKPGDRVRIRM